MKYAHIEELTGKILGWYTPEIHTDIPTPNVEVSDELWQTALANGHNAIDSNGTTFKDDFRTLEQIAEDEMRLVIGSVQKYLDDSSKVRGYDGILSLCTYVTDSDPIFAAEGQVGVDFRSASWRHCYQVLADVESGVRVKPTIEELIAELPTLVWPS